MSNEPIYNPFDEDEKAGRQPVLWGILGLGALCLCGLMMVIVYLYKPDPQELINQYFPSPTVTNTRTPTSTPTKTLTPTPNLTATQRAIQTTATAQVIQTTIADAQGNWNILLSEPFDNNNENDWYEGTDVDDYAKIVRTVGNGVYQWDVTSKKGLISWITANTISVSDFLLTVEAQQPDGSLSTDYGVFFRENYKNDFYYFGIDNDSFHVSLSFNDEWIDIIDWTSSDAIYPDQPNRLTVIANGAHFIFLVNDQIVGEAIDDHISLGKTGVAVSLYGADLEATFEFDNFELREP